MTTDLLSILNLNYDKLTNKEMVNILWKEILKEERCEQYLDQLIEYSFHFPVDTEMYLQQLNEKFDELNKEDLRTIDGHLKAYIITFLYYCTNTYDRRVSMTTTMLASGLYLKLVSIPGIGKIFFEKNMYKIQLYVCVSVVRDRSIPDSSKLYVIKLLKKNCLKNKLDVFLLKGTANTFTGCLMVSSTRSVRDIKDVTPLQLYCINALKDLILSEDNGCRLKCILESIFRCLKSSVIENVPDQKAVMDVFIVVIRDVLQRELDVDKYQYLLEAFCAIWGHEDFTCYDEAVIFMNLMKVQHYKELVRKMVLYSQSKNHKKYLINIMHLLYAIVKNLPTFPLDKVEVLYSCALRNVVYHFIDKDKKFSNAAIEIVTKMCLMVDNPMLTNIFNQFQCTGKFINISVEALLLAFNESVDAKWGITSRNQNLLIILAKFLAHTRNVNVELVQKTLNAICKDATPFSMRTSLPTLHELFCITASRERIPVAQAVLKIIFKNAMHHEVSSLEYSDHIFQSMLKPSVINGTTYSPKYYYNYFLTSKFEYESLFLKCHKHIRSKDVQNTIKNMDFREPGAAVLLCCLLNYCDYTEIHVLADYVIDNFPELSCHLSMGPLCVAFEKILKNGPVSDQYYPQLDLIQSSIMEGLFQQMFQVPCIKPAFDLFESIRGVLKLQRNETNMNRLLNISSELAFRRLHCREIGDDSVFMYLNEICILLRKAPTENILRLLESYMENPSKIELLTTFMPDIYIQLLTLFTTLAMMDKRKIPLTLKYLLENLNNEKQIVKILAFKLLFSLCQEMTHEFEEVKAFAFKEMVNADPCLVRICVIVLEELIHDDYIKLTAENFFRFIYVIGCDDLTIFMKEILMKRFILSNQNDVAKFYFQTITYINLYSKLPNYPISSMFYEELIRIKLKMDKPREILLFLFHPLPVKKKFNILVEIATVFEDLVKGLCKTENNFFSLLLDCIAVYKFMISERIDAPPDKQYYNNICKQIEKQIVGYDPHYKKLSYYNEYEAEIRRCTLSLLKLLFFENDQLADIIQVPLFDALIHWIDFVKPEIVQYIHVERGKEYEQYFSKLTQYYKRNKAKFSVLDR